MRITAILLTIFCIQVSAKIKSQTITYSGEKVTLEKLFNVIKKQTGFLVVYNKEQIQNANPVNIKAKKKPLREFLDDILISQNFEYTIEENTISVKRKKPIIEDKPATHNSPPPVTGIVKGLDGKPLEGVNVMIKGTKRGTVTDKDGRFSIDADNGSVLEISSVGFGMKSISVNGASELIVVLEISSSVLDEVQYIAYGTQSKRFQIGNVGSVKSTDIEKQPINNPILALQGRVPGITVTQSSGVPGGAVTIRIQGRNNLDYLSGSDPLVVVDGVPYPSQNLTTFASGWNGSPVLGLSSSSFNTSGSSLSYINPADIESIDVLKDADATAIYGSRGANGAILITTKKGVRGDTKVDVDIQYGIGQVPKDLNLLNTQQYLEMRKEAFANDNRPLPSITTSPFNAQYDINGLWDTTRYTNWQEELIGGTANYIMSTANVSGGTDNFNFIIGGTYRKETTVFPGDFANTQGSMHFNINAYSPNKKFQIQTSGSYLHGDNNIPGVDFTQFLLLAPDAPALYNSDSSLNWAPNPQGNSSWNNPLSFNRTIFESKTTNLISNTLLSYKLIDNLEVRATVGFNQLSTNQFLSAYDDHFKPEERATLLRSSQFTDNAINSLIIEPQLSYKLSFAKYHKIDVLLGMSYQEKNSKGVATDAVGQGSDQQLRNLGAATSYYVSNTNASYRYNGLFGRLNYNFGNKYLINLSARRDGSSRFGANNLFHSYGALGVGWIFTEEKFLKNNRFISFGKLKFSYGKSGNDQIEDYLFMSLYGTAFGLPYQDSRGLVAGGLVNADLQWEETRKIQGGIETGFANDKVLISLNFYNNRTSNSLANVYIPITTGFPQYVTNFSALIQNSGWEATLRTENIKRKLFSWYTSFNLTIPKNELVEFPGLKSSAYADLYEIGYPLNISKVFSHYGVDPATGDYLQLDTKGNPTSTPDYLTDRTAIINYTEQWYGGLQNSIQYKGFELDFLIQFTKQMGLDFIDSGFPPGFFAPEVSNQPTTVLSRWQKPGDVTTIKKYTSRFSFPYFDDRTYKDISYARLKNVSLSYKLNSALSRKIGLRQVNIYMLGQNLFTITSYHGLDPETKSVTSLPPLRVVTIGAKIVI